ncbi:Antiviral helicase SKI2 [Nakaseomyces bracarensis]|uniref:Antiviral helicase SKI2 n=1 Tax=Nakaseomyces bracarensis TaxID=273131 RepID=A0ABR4NSL1_9SACH
MADIEDACLRLREKINSGSYSEEFENLRASDVVEKPLNDDEVDEELKERFLKPSNVFSWELLDIVQTPPNMNFLDTAGLDRRDTYDYKNFIQIPEPTSRTSYFFKRKGLDGKIFDHKIQVSLKDIAAANSSNSLSLNRSINFHGNTIRGSTAQLPFTPGGIVMDAVKGSDGVQDSTGVSTMGVATKLLHKDEQGLFDIPEGLERGIIPKLQAEVAIKEGNNDEEVEDMSHLNEIDNEINVQRQFQDNLLKDEEDIEEQTSSILNKGKEQHDPSLDNIDDLLPMGIDFGRSIINSNKGFKKKEWAHVVDLNHKIENFDELVPNPARTWPFELDTFQKEAIYHLEQSDSVFVAAHTSAGKTVVAEYAIAMSKRNMTKTIYTSPIKALSNQKFRDFKETFEDVDIGLITGDVQINPEANCLIMTTEILRSMLYRGADLIRDVEFVIFDEVHYVNDQDRGVVWEEVIIMLPQHVKFILLSATVPNTYEFANWIGRTKQKNIYVISTPKRPVPLEINIWAKNELIPVINERREFSDANFRKHKTLLEGQPAKGGDQKQSNQKGGTNNRGGSRGGRGGSRGGSRGGARGGSRGAGAIGSNKRQFFRRSGPNKKTWSNLIDYLRKKELLPMVVFVFSKKRCEEYADWLEGVNFCNSKERSQIHMFIEKSITRLRKEDRELPQILKIRSLLERGIAVHHGGLLPIVKELIEILFSKGFIKVLFATETFAMGLNLPTRTVVFSEIQKHDGNGLRDLTPGEFTQMAGRAGRRGLDTIGTVIIMAYTDPLQIASFKEVTLGVPTKLESRFRLTYNMILNLLRIEALKVEEMIKYSFSENSKQTLQPEQEKKIESLKKKMDDIKVFDDCQYCCEGSEKLLDLVIRYKETTSIMMSELAKTDVVLRTLKVGRLVVYRDAKESLKLGFIFRLNIREKQAIVFCFTTPNDLSEGKPNHLPYFANMPRYILKNFSRFKAAPYFAETISIESIELTTAYSVRTSLNELTKGDESSLSHFESEVNMLLRISKNFKESEAEKKANIKVHQSALERKNIIQEIEALPALKCPKLAEHFAPLYEKFMVEKEIKQLYHLMSDQNLNLLPDYEKRLAVLYKTGFINQNHNVLLKGRVACEINSGYELVLTELILDNFLGNFEPEEIVALLSVFVYEGRTKEEESPVVTPRLAKGKQRIEEIYSKMLQVYEEEQIPLTKEEAEFLERKRFALMNVVYEWARGMSFKEIMEISPEAEGTVVRVITWLDEICREVKTASIIIGNTNLHLKMTRAQELIKRDIVFAASLYL